MTAPRLAIPNPHATLGAVSRPVTSEMIGRAGAALAEGGWAYTPRQLYYATCAAAEAPPRSPARGQFALAALLGLVALILLPVRPAALAIGAVAAVSLVVGLITQLTWRHVSGRMLAISYPEFEALLRSAEPPAGLVTDVQHLPENPDAVTLVLDAADNAAAVAANLGRPGAPRVRIVTVDSPDLGHAAVVALHDASPRGCALPLELVDAGARVVDAGLRPAWVDRDDVQVVQGAPARVPRDLSSLLTDDELDWLRSGRRVELSVLEPQRLMRLVSESVARARRLSPADGVPAGVAATLPSLP